MLKMDGFDDCVLGILERVGQDTVIVYDTEKVIEKLESQGMTHEEAQDFFSYNQLNCFMGKHTPGFVMRMTLEEIEDSLDAEVRSAP